jgi:hypothetical protein
MNTTTINPYTECDYIKWSDVCINIIKKDLYSYFSPEYTKEDINCSLENIDLEQIYKSPRDFYINAEPFLNKMKKRLNICRNKKLKIIKTYLSNFFIIGFIILSVIIIISYFRNLK